MPHILGSVWKVARGEHFPRPEHSPRVVAFHRAGTACEARGPWGTRLNRRTPATCRRRSARRTSVGRGCLKDVQLEVVAAVVAAVARIEVVPPLVVDRDTHLRRVTVVHAVGAAIVLLSPEIL